jgi:hypothetical protein
VKQLIGGVSGATRQRTQTGDYEIQGIIEKKKSNAEHESWRGVQQSALWKPRA